MKKKIFTALGLMTGTSMDGVDLSLIKSDGYAEFTQILDIYFKFDPNLQKRLLDLRNQLFTDKDLDKFSEEIDEIERDFTLFNAEIIDEVLKKHSFEVDLIGFHGQTVFHDSSKKISKQIGNGKLLSQVTKKLVVNNFRKEDLINEGQGAPLTPIFHRLLSKILNKKKKLVYHLILSTLGVLQTLLKSLAIMIKMMITLMLVTLGLVIA